MNEETIEVLKQVITEDVHKGVKVAIEVEDVMGKDILAIGVELKGKRTELLKMLLCAMNTDETLHRLIRAAAQADDCVSVQATSFQKPI